MSRSGAFKLVRLLVSAALIAFLIARLDLGQVVKHLKGLAITPLLLAAGSDLLMITTNATRWKLLLRAKGIDLSLGRLLYYNLTAVFFSSFLPTSVGGDFARVVAVSTATEKRADAFASVVIDRLLGFFVLLPIMLISILFVSQQLQEWRLILTVGVVGVLLCAGAYIVLLRPVARRLSRALDPALRPLARFKARERLEKAYEAIVVYKDARGVLLAGLGLSVVSRLFWILGCYFIARAFSLNLGIAVLLLVVPIVELLRMIPISISGIGVREAAFVAMLRQFGVEDSLGFAFSVVVYLVFFVFAVIGGILYGTRQFAREKTG
jgi:uncharacterized protein (TIRG00374 family)